MVLTKYILKSADISELNTEIRYLTASARAEGAEVICYTFDETDVQVVSKMRRTIYRILSTMKKKGLIQLIAKSINDSSKESEYIKNKYGDYIESDELAIYVKI